MAVPFPSVDDLTVDLRQFAGHADCPDLPLAFVDLEKTELDSQAIVLPPFPLIGLGARDLPFAALCDTVIEPPVSAETVLRGVYSQPLAAAAIVRLLRLGDSLAPLAMLDAESATFAMLQGSLAHRAWLAERPNGDATAPGSVRLDRADDALVVTLDRPESGNAINRPMRDGLCEAFRLAAADNTVNRVVLRGEGRSFCLGAELGEFGTTTDPATAHAIRARTLPARALLSRYTPLEVRLQGACIGAGLELGAFADWVVATPDAWFQLPELAMGILPGAGGCTSLPRRIGRQRTALMVLSGKRIPAKAALDWGLVDRIVEELP